MDEVLIVTEGREVEDEVEEADMVVDVLATDVCAMGVLAGVLSRDPVHVGVHVLNVVSDGGDVVLRPFVKVDGASLLERLFKSSIESGVRG